MKGKNLQALKPALERTPDVRVAEVRRARRLVADPTYPSRPVLRKTAALLARHLSPVQN
jgi:hypothetical protein